MNNLPGTLDRVDGSTSCTSGADHPSTCPICSARGEKFLIAPDYHYGNVGVWTVHQCAECRHLYQYPLPKNDDELRSYYPKCYYAYAPPRTNYPLTNISIGLRCRYQFLRYRRGYDHLPVRFNPLGIRIGSKLFRKPLNLQTPPFRVGGRILDFGCGSGSNIAFLRAVGWDAEGIEVDDAAAECGRRAGLPIRTGSVQELEEKSDHYDHILAFHSIEHLIDPQRFFRAARRALRPGGTLRMDVPNGQSLSIARFREFAYYVTMPVHVHLFSPQSLQLALERAGFTAIQMTTFSVRESQMASWHCRWQSNHGLKTGRLQRPKGFAAWQSWFATLPLALSAKWSQRGDCIAVCASFDRDGPHPIGISS